MVARLPAVERYNLADQLRRAATSSVLNIAEGYGRFHYPDTLRFYYIARGSLNVVNNHQRPLIHSALRALNGYIRYVRNQRQGRDLYGDRLVREDGPVYHLSDVLLDGPTDE